jgi:competence ComEA-like helix-hairpin-helix protein
MHVKALGSCSPVIIVVGILASFTAAASETEDASAIGEQVTGLVCASSCHGWDEVFAGERKLPSQWDFVVSDMAGRGAIGTDEQFDQARSFLKRTWGAVWINNASARDLEAVLALPAEDAAAVIAYRKEHGRFTDLASLKEVPGIDTAVIDMQADAIIFN